MGRKYIVKSIREPATNDDGLRVLVDRLWPRGVRKDKAHLDAWWKDIAPSTELRKWYRHDAGKYDEFVKRYRHEIEGSVALDEFREDLSGHDVVTLLFDAHDPELTHAHVLKQVLLGR